MTADEAPERPDEEPSDPPDAAEPEVPDHPLGVPADADAESGDDQRPGFQRDAPNAG
jgi:hypothetical protein